MQTLKQDDTLTIFLEGRIDAANAPAVDEEITAALNDAKDCELCFNAEKLEYISSAGLRVLLKAAKGTKGKASVTEVSPEVFDIFEVTGFTDLFDVKKRLREISIEGLEKIGEGATSEVYRLDQETIIKVFHKNVQPVMITRETKKARTAFVAGVPTAIPYDMVKVGNQYGTVFELLNAENLLQVMGRDPENAAKYASEFGVKIRELHKLEVDTTKFTNIKEYSVALLPKLIGTAATAEEVDLIRQMYEILPDRTTFIHGDCQPGNVMLQDGEYIFIDLSSGGFGHPLFDLTSMCTMYKMYTLLPDEAYEASRQRNYLIRPFTKEQTKSIWNAFFTAYMNTDDEELYKKAEEQAMAYACARFLFVAVMIPGLVPDRMIQSYKNHAIEYARKGIQTPVI